MVKTHDDKRIEDITSNPYAGRALSHLGGFADRCFAGSDWYNLGCSYRKAHNGPHSNDAA